MLGRGKLAKTGKEATAGLVCGWAVEGVLSYDQGLANELFLSELLHRLGQRRAKAFRFPSRNETEA